MAAVATGGLSAQMAAMGVSSGGGGGRQEPVAEESIKMLPNTRWQDIVPPCGCADFLRRSTAVRG